MTVVMKNYWFIGDIHGELGLLDSLLEAIYKHDPHELIFMGDYIDRGHDSRGVLERLMGLEVPAACLMGNHELMLLSAMEDFAFGYNPMELWYFNGAEATLHSFGFSGFFSFQSQIEPRYLHFLRNLRMSHLVEAGSACRVLATHAGVSPSIPIADQLLLKDYQDLQQYILDKQLDLGDSFLWTREEFFNSPASAWKGYVVIHGHTPTQKLRRLIKQERDHEYHFVGDDLVIRRDETNGEVVSVGIDSGSCYSGRLTGLGIFLDHGKGNGESVSIQSLTVTQKDIFQRDLGPIRS
jgi:serine/threonine protein phosphatase 1